MNFQLSLDPCNFDNKIKYIIVGLGNPGEKYKNTRHNVGFMALDRIAKEYGIDINLSKFQSKCGIGFVGQTKVLLLKPQTFMNESGKAVLEAMNFYKISLENIRVLFDDISFEPAKMRIKNKGTHGGHNGIRSIINLCGAENFIRIKIGVGERPNRDWDLADWVLSSFREEDLSKINDSINNSVNAIKLITENNIQKAMNLYN